MDNSEFRFCPFCSEEIKVKAVKCKYCKSLLDEESVNKIEQVQKIIFSDSNKQTEGAYAVFEEKGEVVPEEEKAEDQGLSWDYGTYRGGIKNGKLHGQGVMVLPDGHRYEGDWSEGKKHGEGVLVYPNGAKRVGRWVDDLFINEESNASVVPDYLSEPGEERFYPDEETKYPMNNDDPAKGELTFKRVDSQDDDLVYCSYCSGKILAYAIKCKHCGAMTNNI